MFKLNTLNAKMCSTKPIQSIGTRHIGRDIVELARIYVPPMADNPVRKKGKDINNVQSLTISLMNGCDYNLQPPVVRPCKRVIDGVRYDFELVCGNHRFEALQANGYDRWIFDIHEFALDGLSYEDSLFSFQLEENDHAPRLTSSVADVVNIISRMITNNSKLVENDEKSIAQYVDTHCKNMHHQTRGKIVRGVMAANGTYQDVVTYTAKDVKSWVNKNTSMKIGGEYDARRKKHGWSVLEGYEYEYLMNATRKFAETGKESYFICHTKAPTAQESLDFKRNKIIEKFELLESCLVDVFEFYQENGRFPWDVQGFLPADKVREENPTELVIL
jgi:hypothetical protein